MMKIPFNKPQLTGKELDYIAQACDKEHLASDGFFTKQCEQWIADQIGCHKALLTHSATAALEMAALLIGIEPGDEVIMPSYTFVSTANAFILRGARPVFVDIRPDTLNMDESKVEEAVTEKTCAIVPVHYAGVGVVMEKILEIAEKHHLWVIEDAAQGVLAKYQGNPLGSFGHLSVISFHETKNLTSGEGGALLINDERFLDQADILSHKGTDRTQFFLGKVDQYTWQDLGSSYMPSEILAAFLWAQLQEAEKIQKSRLRIWNQYHQFFTPLQENGLVKTPFIPDECENNAHLYYLILPEECDRRNFLHSLAEKGIGSVFHYSPLHLSKAGRRLTRTAGSLHVTEELSRRLIRLPLWSGLTVEQIQTVCSECEQLLSRNLLETL